MNAHGVEVFVRFVLVGHACLATLFTLVTAVSVLVSAWQRRRSRSSTDAPLPDVVLLRPAERVDLRTATAWANDASSYRGRVLRIVCLPSRAGVEAPVLDALGDAQLAVSDLADDTPINRKVAHLEAGLRHARALGRVDGRTIVVHADADVVLAKDSLDELVMPLVIDPKTGLSFAAPSPHGGSALASLLAKAILAASPQAFAALFALSRVTASAPAIAGKLVAVPVRVLDAVGGYARIASTIAEDIELVEAVHEAGFAIAMAPRAVETRDDSRTLSALLAQLTRWVRVASSHRPGLLFTYPLFVAPLAACLAFTIVAGIFQRLAGNPIAPIVAPLAALGLARLLLALALAATHYGGAAARSICLAPFAFVAGDLAVMVGVVRALRPAPIRWAGRRYRIGRGGRIEACTPENAQSA